MPQSRTGSIHTIAPPALVPFTPSDGLPTSSTRKEFAVEKQADETGYDDEDDAEYQDDSCFLGRPVFGFAPDEFVDGGLDIATDNGKIDSGHCGEVCHSVNNQHLRHQVLLSNLADFGWPDTRSVAGIEGANNGVQERSQSTQRWNGDMEKLLDNTDEQTYLIFYWDQTRLDRREA